MKRYEGGALLINTILAGAFFISSIMAATGYCDPCSVNNTARVEAEQRHWDMEAMRFLYCDQCYPSTTIEDQRLYSPVQTDSQGPENGSFEYWRSKGDEFYLNGNYEEAASAYSEALKLQNYSEVRLNLANCLYFLGRYQDALGYYDSVLAEDTQDESALQGRVQSLLALNRTAEANIAQETLNLLIGRNVTRIGSTSNIVTVGDH